MYIYKILNIQMKHNNDALNIVFCSGLCLFASVHSVVWGFLLPFLQWFFIQFPLLQLYTMHMHEATCAHTDKQCSLRIPAGGALLIWCSRAACP